MTEVYTYRKRVEFSETDAAGIVHFSNYFRFMEMAEHAFFRSLGFSIHPQQKGYGFPRLQASCEFKAPIRFEDEIVISVNIVEKRRKSISYAFIINKVRSQGEDVDHAPQEIARGSFVAVCIRLNEAGGRFNAQPIPPEIDHQLQALLPAVPHPGSQK